MSDYSIQIVGCGYIGKKIAAQLSARNIALQCMVQSKASRQQCEVLGFKTIQCDFDQQQPVINTISEKTRWVYLVPPTPRGKTDARIAQFIESLNLLEQVPEKIILISTTGVYGDCQGEWIDENREVNPQADRAHRRLSAEQQLSEYCNKNNVPLIILRVPGIYGADKLPLKRITSGEPIVRAVDSGFTNRIHAEDLVAFCVEALTCDVNPGVYNCCDGEPSTMNDYFMCVADAKGLPRPEEITLQQAQQQLSSGMLSYLAESKRISNEKLLMNFKTRCKYPDLKHGLKDLK